MIKNSIRIFLTLCAILAAWFLPKRSFVKYLPVTLFSSSILLAEMFYLTIHRLWKAKDGPSAMTCNTLVLVLGPYFFANLWVFHLTKGKFFLYSLVNIIADYIYSFHIIRLFEKAKFFKLKISSKAFFIMIVSNAFINYVFQKLYEKANVQKQADLLTEPNG